MATAKTECSELSVGFGLLGINSPASADYTTVATKFDETLSQPVFARFIETYPTLPLYSAMKDVGLRLRSVYQPFLNLERVQWTGGDLQAATMSTAKDLLARNIPISVKADSRVVGNPSPYNLFKATPQASGQAKGMGSWYLEAAPVEYQAFYETARSYVGLDSPLSVQEFEASRNKRQFVKALQEAGNIEDPQFQTRYLVLARKVSQVSAEIFQTNYENAMNSPVRNTTLERMAKMFFRMNAVDYLLCGVDGNGQFAVVIPDLTTWLKTWRFKSIEAKPALSKGQSIVNFEIICERKKTGETYCANFHAEVRWSHGKFSSVEGKLYREFNWTDVPFFEDVIR
jgi:hypothetical protein